MALPEEKSISIAPQFVIILAFFILTANWWYSLFFNIIFIGYDIFEEMRYSIVFFAIFLRIISYPLRLIGNSLSKKEKIADEEQELISQIKDDVTRKRQQQLWLKKHKNVLLFVWFNMGFSILNTLMVGRIFLENFTSDRTLPMLWSWVPRPDFPVQTLSWLPIVGMTDLSVINQKLNFISAIGAGVVGIAEVVIRGKTSKREIWMYLLAYPLGAYFITNQVPSGFEFTLICIEVLTLALIFIEKAAGSSLKRLKEAAKIKMPVLDSTKR
ncbi:MAG TPA: hypothetical protein PKL83_04370 [bacterium]|nr:hypothetical protein [bacterium]